MRFHTHFAFQSILPWLYWHISTILLLHEKSQTKYIHCRQQLPNSNILEITYFVSIDFSADCSRGMSPKTYTNIQISLAVPFIHNSVTELVLMRKLYILVFSWGINRTYLLREVVWKRNLQQLNWENWYLERSLSPDCLDGKETIQTPVTQIHTEHTV